MDPTPGRQISWGRGVHTGTEPMSPTGGDPARLGMGGSLPSFFGGGMIRNFEIRYRKAFKIYTKHLVL